MLRYLIILISAVLLFASFTTKHPYHVGSVELNYNANSQTFEITGRFFLDDLENALNKDVGKKLHFQDAKMKAQMETRLKMYCEQHLKLKADNKFVSLKYLGFLEDAESVEIYLESEKVKKPVKVETAVSFLYNLFDDQINIIHIIVDGKRQSHRLNYPDRYLYKTF